MFLQAPLRVSASGKIVFTDAIMCFHYREECFNKHHYVFALVGKKVLHALLCVWTSEKKVFTGAIMCFH